MSKAIDNLKNAIQSASAIRPKVGGFPVLAEVMRQAGVKQNLWYLPSCQSIYITKEGNVVSQESSLVTGHVDIPEFNKAALIKAIRSDQAGESTFPEFLRASWDAGVVHYHVDLEKRTVTYYGVLGESYVEDYPAVEVS
ncbi:DUF1398 domain-containing protein [Legionella anisa]|uniref:DUF1398 domain-containing protein n=1 Tax=Legionella anisa TaxID=28082 RepID=A0AAX0WX50_9GAMM|nr:DUF1398 family protein [Legionella anisa]AWN72465.1 DUF1398 domain-containing protein [Legionella anisa]KTC72340.1 hypothetical protein Lani_1260 [Legionella anisa]MBN5935554.1 DUF1398 family protein [Legionella anisa]MCW8423229.1 DUF1398 family protein [Legionella anisa]MCW8446747.1 DUF1398 family protein [Legionella anisa]